MTDQDDWSHIAFALTIGSCKQQETDMREVTESELDLISGAGPESQVFYSNDQEAMEYHDLTDYRIQQAHNLAGMVTAGTVGGAAAGAAGAAIGAVGGAAGALATAIVDIPHTKRRRKPRVEIYELPPPQ